MKAVIRISTRLRSTAPIPREFHMISGLEHLGLIYQGKIITDPVEFNSTLAAVTDRRFANRGCEFFPYMLTAEDEAKMTARPAPVVVEPEEPSDTTPEIPEDNSGNTDSEIPESETTTAKFRIDGKGIYLGDERIAGLFGDDKQLRVTAAYTDLRPEIEAWLATQSPE